MEHLSCHGPASPPEAKDMEMEEEEETEVTVAVEPEDVDNFLTKKIPHGWWCMQFVTIFFGMVSEKVTLSKVNRDLQRLGMKFGHKESPGKVYAKKKRQIK